MSTQGRKVPRWIARFRPSRAPAEMSFLEHLDELRSVILTCLAAVLILAVVAWFFSGDLMDLLVRLTVGQAQSIKPMEAFATRIKIALLMAFVVALPFTAFQIWGFVVPGLFQHERRLLFPIVVWSTLLFIVGLAFSTFALTPTMLRILTSFATETVKVNLSIGFLFDFYLKMGFACGLLFQLPLVIAILSFFGIVTPEFLKSKWRHAIVIILIVAAVVTPGDGPSQLVLAAPIVLLYFVSIWISKAVYRQKALRSEEEGGDDGTGGPAPGGEGSGTDQGPDGGAASGQSGGPAEDSGFTGGQGEAKDSATGSLEEPAGAEEQGSGPRYLQPPPGDWAI